MSTSKIRIRKVCAWCGNEFEAQKVTTQYSSKRCAEHAYKDRKRHEKKSSFESNQEKEQEKASCSKLEGREFLSVAEVAQLLHVTSRAIYYLIERGVLPASQLSNRWTIVRRADIDAMLVARPYEHKPKTTEPEIKEYYDRLIKRGKKHSVALNNIKNKLLRIIVALVRKKTLYDPNSYKFYRDRLNRQFSPA